MNRFDQKLQLVEAFGTKKALKKVTSLRTNQVDDSGLINTADKGIRDSRLAQRAHVIEDEQETLKKDLLSQGDKRLHLYSKAKILPSQIIDDMPYKLTFEALKKEDEE